MLSLARTWSAAAVKRELTGCCVVHREARAAVRSSALMPGVSALTLGEFVGILNGAKARGGELSGIHAVSPNIEFQ